MAVIMPNPPRLCIFCGGTPISKEDIWPTWTRPYFPVTSLNHTIGQHILETDRRLHGNTTKVSGDPKSRRVKMVCKRCNNGWMSILQNQAKPFLLPLMNGEKTTVNERKQNIIAAWSAMTVICAEYITPRRAAIGIVARRHLYLHKLAPFSMRIWIGNFHRNKWPAHWVREY
jgi:hypothetical protein